AADHLQQGRLARTVAADDADRLAAADVEGDVGERLEIPLPPRAREHELRQPLPGLVEHRVRLADAADADDHLRGHRRTPGWCGGTRRARRTRPRVRPARTRPGRPSRAPGPTARPRAPGR